MNRYFIFILVFVSFILFAGKTFADSPVTSTNFYKAYLDKKIIKEAHESGVLNKRFTAFLLSKKTPVDQKAALINALSWEYNGKNNAKDFKKALYKKYNLNNNISDSNLYNSLYASDLMCLGYLTVMDDYFSPEKALNILKLAKAKDKKSFTVAIIYAIVQGQKAFDTDWAKIWEVTDEVINDKNLTQDMRPEAVQIIVDYMILYQGG